MPDANGFDDYDMDLVQYAEHDEFWVRQGYEDKVLTDAAEALRLALQRSFDPVDTIHED